jgi:phage shock protein PspC (stress-responsive transcriptional regulator)
MKKVININFQGRVLPIEEAAYDILKQYVESLRRYFANEEGRDEIINDIESRIAELFNETLKKGSTCITEEDVNKVIAGMGRPEDFEDDEAKVQSQLGSEQQTYSGTQANTGAAYEPKGRLYRNENDKFIGGVCSGVANYLRIDPTVVRILFAVITFGGFGTGFLLYILMWIILPSKALESKLRRRMYRNPDERVVGGVASGLANYFNIQVWVPRLIFALPLVVGIINSVFRNIFWHYDPFPDIVFGSFGGTLFIVYLVLWIVIPEANTATEKLEMRGEKVDLNSIKNTVQEEMSGLKGRVEKMGEDFKTKTQEWGTEFGQTVKDKSQSFAAEAAPVAKKAGRGIGYVIGILFKAFFLFIAGIIAFALLVSFAAVMFSGVVVFPLKNFLIGGATQNFLLWSSLVLFLGVPVVALITWLVRRLMRVKTTNRYLGYIFSGLWVIGIICAISFGGSIARQFRSVDNVSELVDIKQPTTGKLIVKTKDVEGKYYNYEWADGDFPLLSANEDSMLLNTVRVKILKSDDNNYHVSIVKFSRGNTNISATEKAEKIQFNITQNDSILYLPAGFTISNNDKFRNQQVLVIIKVPDGKKIKLDRSLDDYNWFTINVERRRGLNIKTDWDWDNDYEYSVGREYIMTEEKLKRTDKPEDSNTEDWRQSDESTPTDTTANSGGKGYRYNDVEPPVKKPKAPKAPKAPVADSTKTVAVQSADVWLDKGYLIQAKYSR